MMKTKIAAIAGTLLISAGLCTASYADVYIKDISVSEGKVTAECRVDNDSTVTYEVYTSGTQAENPANIAALGEGHPSAGEFKIIFGLDCGGSFTFRVHDGGSYAYKDFDYADSAARLQFVEDIKKALNNENAVDAKNALNAVFKNEANKAVMNTVGINFSTYADYDDTLKDAICGTFVEKANGQTIDEAFVLNCYKLSKNITKLNMSIDGAGKEVLEELDLVFENTAHKKLKKNDKAWVEKAFEKNIPYADLKSMEDMYQTVRALCEVNTAKTGSILKTLKNYAAVMGIENDAVYLSYIEDADASSNKALVEALAKNPAYTVNDLLIQLSANTDSDSGSGLGGGSSVKGNSSSVSGSYTVAGTQDKKEDIAAPEQPAVFFSDMNENHWAYEAVKALKEKGVLSGYADGSFAPDKTVSREEFVKMIVTAFGIDTDGAASHFYDVFDDDWFYPYVSAAYCKGIVTGNDKGLFSVGADITRQDAAVIAARVMEICGVNADAVREYAGFNDESVISDYALEAVIKLFRGGKISGTDAGNFEPLRPCTRAEAAVIIYGILR